MPIPINTREQESHCVPGDVQKENPNVMQYINGLNRRLAMMENRMEIVLRRINKIESALGVCFDEPTCESEVPDWWL